MYDGNSSMMAIPNVADDLEKKIYYKGKTNWVIKEIQVHVLKLSNEFITKSMV